MSMGKQLVFNTGDTGDSDNVGAYIRDSAGNLIPSQTIAASKWLQVASALFDGSGNAISSTGGALNVTSMVLDRSNSGSLGALNATVVVSTAGTGSGILQLTGTWVGTVVVEGSDDGGTTWTALNLVAQPYSSSTGIVASVAANGDYSILGVSAWTQVRARMSAYTSGSASAVINLSLANDSVFAYQLDPANLKTQAWAFDGSGNAINSTSNALNVYLTNTPTFDVGVADGSSFTVGTSIEQPTGGVFASSFSALSSGKTGAFSITAYRALNVSLNDQSGNYLIGQKAMAGSIPVAIASDQSAFPIKLQDGSGNAISSTSGSLNVDVTNTVTVTGTVTANAGTGTFTVSDAALANTAIQAGQQSVTTSAAALIGSPLSARKYVFIQNAGNQPVYIGQSGITSSTGFPIPAGATLDARIGASVAIYAISKSGTQTVPTLELS